MIVDFMMRRVAQMIAATQRSPIYRRPDEYGMSYEDVTFPSSDGVVLEGWYMPAAKPSNKIVVCNHFSPANRYGYAGHLKGWRRAGGFEVNFLPKYKALVEAGYNVLAYDLRNHGTSAPAQNGGYNPSLFEFKDVLGSLDFVRSNPVTKDMEIHLHSMCLGGNATLVAMGKQPEAFADVKSMILLQPISGDALVRKLVKNMRMGKKAYAAFERHYREIWGFRIEDSSPQKDAANVTMPTFVVQVRNDAFTFAEEDVQAVYDNIPVEDKKLYWIEDTTQRFRGYQFFSEHPEQMVAWYDAHS
ncbi:alpha-beta hydrolase superfamily lysophospholipase [Shimia isoporae]|uniref:Alpha-beta hydrolase superfamily lysophospholipase n=1 Tax=Shimia isoporae TaxID=647720 RepID=A0A4R1NJW4_9RHOB|nr:alpha/beta hydrolase [Shimia isoporae]TCL08586.1 alpha-beta hydrolase superfamily lysophospholipase [Shimia isoporae]